MGCGTVTIKYLLFIVNLIFAVGGLALVITGSLIMSNIVKFKEVLGENMGHHHAHDPAVFNVVVGSIVLLIAFFGCCGAVQESHGMVITYSVLMCIILLVQLICGFFVHIHTSEIVEIVEEEMVTQMANYNKSGNEGHIAKEMWDDWQQDRL
ncbi:hypothetical protein B566_EDAN007680 [Ephemera danica]|nr:hypothetical protein B566_EDAN007680 [Ephemera danica]